MPQYQAPQQYPAPIYRDASALQQDQGQNQQTNQNSRSSSENNISTSGSLSNIQINNYNPGKLELVNVGSKQIPTLSLSTWTNGTFDNFGENNMGVSLSFNIPLGGQEAFDKIAAQRIRARDQQYAVDTIAICTKLKIQGVDISQATDPKVVKLRTACKGIAYNPNQAILPTKSK